MDFHEASDLRCVRCGHRVGEDGNVNLDLGYAYCATCEQAYQESLAIQFPHGQCQTCGCTYRPFEVPCRTCVAIGEVLVRPHDPFNPQWADCGKCSGTGTVTVIDGFHEETLCGLRGEDYDQGEEPATFVTVRRWADEQAMEQRSCGFCGKDMGEPYNRDGFGCCSERCAHLVTVIPEVAADPRVRWATRLDDWATRARASLDRIAIDSTEEKN